MDFESLSIREQEEVQLPIRREIDSKENFRGEMFDLFVEFFCKKQPVYLKNVLEELEKSIILKVLWRVHGNQKEAAKVLGIKYTTLNEKLKKYKIRFFKRAIP